MYFKYFIVLQIYSDAKIVSIYNENKLSVSRIIKKIYFLIKESYLDKNIFLYLYMFFRIDFSNLNLLFEQIIIFHH